MARRILFALVLFGLPILNVNILPTSCRIGDVTTTDAYLCALNGTSLVGSPWDIGVGTFVVELLILAIARKPR